MMRSLALMAAGAWADQVDRPEAIHALGFAHDIDVAAAPLLQVPDGLAPAPNDQAHRPIGGHDLHAVFAVLERGLDLVAYVAIEPGPSDGAHPAVLYDAVDGRLCLGAPRRRPRNLALAKLLVGG